MRRKEDMELEQREILFRGQHEFGKKWVYGDFSRYLVCGRNAVGIVDDKGCFNVTEPLTVTQYTGLNDCTTWEELTEEERMNWTRSGKMPSEWKGKRIFERDIIEVDWKGKRVKALVWFSEGSFLYEIEPSFSFHLDDADNPKVIGNDFDNPELLNKNEN